nr:HTH domain-containing protein [Enterococcus faecium]
MQPKETFTIRELSELFEISRQAISKHVDKLDPSLLAKNERGYKVVLRSGVLQLASNLGNQRLLDRLHEYEKDNDKNIYISSKNVVVNELLDKLREENEFLREQLSLKEQKNKSQKMKKSMQNSMKNTSD